MFRFPADTAWEAGSADGGIIPADRIVVEENRQNSKNKIYNQSSPTFICMFSTSDKPVVENTEENRKICRKYCTICQNYKRHSLEKYQPTELFCGCGTSSAPNMREIGCFCPACELFTKHHLRGGYFCVRH